MKNPMQKLRRFFVRSATFKATAARAATQAPPEDDDNGTRLSGAFIVVLVLHIIAVVGVFAFARIKEGRNSNASPASPAQTAAPKNAPTKPPAAKSAASSAAGMIAAAHPPQVATRESLKTPPASTHMTHIVKDHETLTKIAFAYSTGVPDLVSSNKLKNQDDIRPGQVLTIPSGKPAPKTAAAGDTRSAPTAAPRIATAVTDRKAAKTYVVRKGDTPLKIAREHGCTYEELMKVNSIRDPKKIQTGQTLKLPVKNG